MNLAGGTSFLAGLLTTLSPCVLPILPMMMGSSIQKNRAAPFYMVLGMMLSFVVFGVVLSRFGSFMGLSSEELRYVSVVLIMFSGLALISKRGQDFISRKLLKFSNIGSTHAMNLNEGRPEGALLLGGLLGVIWSPCVGPTLGVAISLAGTDSALVSAVLMMSFYAIGAGIPMLIIAYGSRGLVTKIRPSILDLAQKSKRALGIILLITGAAILLGFDKMVEGHLLEILPRQWVDLITM
jgi:cytochrome c-type biogenesis protein